jgi:hypothetical protein
VPGPLKDNNSANGMVTVIVPCYNYAHFLSETLDSVLAQSYTNWECIIVDDGSTDNTKEVADTYIKKDPRFKYIHQTNQGLSAARNKGIELAKGEFIQLLDSDDLITPEKLRHQATCFSSNADVDMIYSNYNLMEADGKKRWSVDASYWIDMKHTPFKEFLHYWEKGFTIPIHCYLFRKSCFTKWGNFNVTLPTHEDLALQLNFSLHGATYKMLNEVSSFYRVHSASMAKDFTKMHKGYLMALIALLDHPNASFNIQQQIAHRYFQEVLNTVLDTCRGRKNSIFKAMTNRNSTFLKIFGILLLPFYLIYKIIGKFI